MNTVCHKIYTRIIKRQTPHAILSWRYFLPNQSAVVKQHKKTFFGAWSNYPRIVWWLIALYSFTLWYLFNGWRQIAKVWTNQSFLLYQQEGIKPVHQLAALMVLTFMHSTPPMFYYRYSLFRYPEKNWLDFIYTHELPHWHHITSPNISKKSRHLMSNKHHFSLAMIDKGLPSIPSIHILSKGELFAQNIFYTKASLFFKPLQGSRKEGCFTVNYSTKSGRYFLQGEEESEAKINNFIQQKVDQKNYLVQPLLTNHIQFNTYFPFQALITIRLVTAITNNLPVAISALIELPIIGSQNKADCLSIAINSGQLTKLPKQNYSSIKRKQEIEKAIRQAFIIPLWRKVITIAEEAHNSFKDISTIGWDLAITDQGIFILEGNINWAVAAHQIDSPQLTHYVF